jgi:hypothetical protein
MTASTRRSADRPLRPAYLAVAGLLALTGFAQMPIFKRYYIADIPGLGWLAQYFVTHALHYLGAVLLLGLLGYALAEALLRRRWPLAAGAGVFQALVLLGLAVTGALRVIKNYEGYTLSEGWIVYLDIAHLALAMALLLGGLAAAIRRGWRGGA